MNIAQIAQDILCLRFQERHFTPIITDVKITGQVNTAYQTEGQYRKMLFREGTVPEHSRVVSEINATRRIFKDRTLRFSDGIGMLPGTEYQGAVDAIDAGILRVEDALDTYVPVYWQRVLEQQQHLNGSWDQNDYPHPNEIRSRYGITVTVLPFPQAEHLNVSGVADIEALREQASQEYGELITNTVTELAVRYQELLMDISLKLETDKDLRTQTLNRARQVASRVNALNFTKNSTLTAIGNQIEQAIDSWDLKQVNNDELTRAVALDTINDILAKAEAFA